MLVKRGFLSVSCLPVPAHWSALQPGEPARASRGRGKTRGAQLSEAGNGSFYNQVPLVPMSLSLPILEMGKKPTNERFLHNGLQIIYLMSSKEGFDVT